MPASESTESAIQDYQNEFFLAAEKGDLATVKKLYENKTIGINPDLTSPDRGITPFYAAVLKGNLEVVNYLLTLSDVNVNFIVPLHHLNVLHVASIKGRADIISAILATAKGKLSINSKALEDEYTPLYLAADANHHEIVKLLLAAGADPSIKTLKGFAPLDATRNNDIVLLLDGTTQKIHSCIIQRMKMLGFKSNDRGLCFGFSETAKLHALSGKKSLHHFNETLFLLSRLKAKDLLDMQTFHEDLAKQAEKKALDELHAKTEKALDEKQYHQFRTMSDENLINLRRKLSVEQQVSEAHYLDILTLFSAIDLEYQGYNYSHLTTERAPCQKQNPKWVTPLIQSLELEKQGGEKTLASFTGAYLKSELSLYFSTLRTRIRENKSIIEPIALTLESSNHCISVIYNPASDTWEIFDANDMPSKFDDLKNYIIDGNTDISQKIAKGFWSNNGDALFETRISTTNTTAMVTKPVIDQWLNDIAPLHNITPEKAKLLDSVKASWLYLAAKFGDEQLVKDLISQGADINGEHPHSPLYIAAQHGHEKVVALLLKQPDIQVNIKVKDGCTPFLVAASHGHFNVIKAMLDAAKKIKLDINMRTDRGNTALFSAAEHGFKDIFHLLLQHQDVHLRGLNDGDSLLSIAAQNGHHDIVKILLAEKGLELDPNVQNNEGLTALYKAALNNHLEIVKTLLQKHFKEPINIDLKSNEGVTPLYQAAQDGYEEIVEVLAKAGADVNSKYSNGQTPAWIAAYNNHANVIAVLAEAKANLSTPHTHCYTPADIAAEKGHLQVIHTLIKAKAAVDLPDADNYTPLFLATQKGYGSIVSALAKAEGTQVNRQLKDGTTPLIDAVKLKQIDALRALIDAKADLSVSDKMGLTPMHWGIIKASANNSTPNLFTPKSCYEIIDLLLESGAKLDVQDASGKLPIDYASDTLKTYLQKVLPKDIEQEQGSRCAIF